MKFNTFERATNREVKDWLSETFDLTPYQLTRLDRHRDLYIDHSPFYFIRKESDKDTNTSPLWRLTLLLWPIYWVLAMVFILFKWLITGKEGLPQKFLKSVHYPWAAKLKL